VTNKTSQYLKQHATEIWGVIKLTNILSSTLAQSPVVQ